MCSLRLDVRERSGGSRRAGWPAPARPRAMRERTVPGGHVEHGGDLGVVEVADVAEHHREAEVLRQPAQGVVEAHPVGHRRVDGVAPASATSARSSSGRAGDRPAPAPAQLVEAGVRRDPVGPRGEGGPAVEAGQARARWPAAPPGWRRRRRRRCRSSGGTGRRAGRSGCAGALRGPPGRRPWLPPPGPRGIGHVTATSPMRTCHGRWHGATLSPSSVTNSST